METENTNIEEDVQKTLHSLDNIQKASPKPFLYTRIMARMERSKASTSNAFELKPAYRRITIAAFVILVAINIFTATFYLGYTSETASESSQEEIYFDQYYPTLTTIDNIEQNLTE